MRFEDEQYVRLYKRDTTTWLMLPWQSKAILPLILRKVDRAGILDLGEDGLEALAVHTQMPLDVIEAGMPALLRRGVLVLKDGLLVWPRYIEGQEAKQSDKARQKAARDRSRDLASAAARGVTVRDTVVTPPSNPDASVTPCDGTVTAGHTASHGVTQSRAELSNEVKSPAEGGAVDPSPALPGIDIPARKARREGAALMRPDWKPTPEHAADVRDRGLHLGRVVEDFTGHWVKKGVRKTPSNWNDTFAKNIDRIMREDWLLRRFQMTDAERSRASWPDIETDRYGDDPLGEAESDAAIQAVLADLSDPLRALDEAATDVRERQPLPETR